MRRPAESSLPAHRHATATSPSRAMAASGCGALRSGTDEKKRAAATAKLVALFDDDEEQGWPGWHDSEKLEAVLALGAADVNVRIGGMTPLLLVRISRRVAARGRSAACLRKPIALSR